MHPRWHVRYSMGGHKRALHNFFTPCHITYSGWHNNVTYMRHVMGKLDIIPSNVQWLSYILIGWIFYDMVLNKCYLSPLLCCGYKFALLQDQECSPQAIWFFMSLKMHEQLCVRPINFVLIVFFLSCRVYNLLVADIMKTKLFYISYHTKYADLKDLLEKSNHRSYPLVDSEGTVAILDTVTSKGISPFVLCLTLSKV